MLYPAATQSRPAAEYNPQPLLAGAAAVLALGVIAGLWLSPAGTLMAVGGAALLVAVFLRPGIALYAAVAIVALADWHLDPNSTDGQRLVYSLADYGIPLTPLELVLFTGAAGMVIRFIFDDEVPFRPGEFLLPITLFLVAVALGIGYGFARGGVDLPALRSETRGFLYPPILYLIGAHFFRTPGSITRLMWFFVIAVNVMALESTVRYFQHVRVYDLSIGYDLAFGHENAILCAAAITYLICRVIWSPTPFSEWKSVLLMALPMIALMVMRRRAGMVALETSMVLLCVYLFKYNIKLFFIGVPIALLGAGLLLAMTWNNPGGTGQFARGVKEVTGQQQSSRDKQSNDYRDMEDINLRLNVTGSPVTGLGFGQPYNMYVDVPNLSGFWSLWQFVPHNTFFWIWMKGGVLAFVTLLALFAAAITRSTQMATSLGKHHLKPVAFASGAFVLMFVLYSYVDLGLVQPRAIAFFGFTLAVIAAVSRVVEEHRAELAEEPAGEP
jgi:hypothetical protein